MKTKYGMQEVWIGDDSKPNGPKCNIFISPDFYENDGRCLVLIKGSAPSIAGTWARSEIVNTSLRLPTALTESRDQRGRNRQARETVQGRGVQDGRVPDQERHREPESSTDHHARAREGRGRNLQEETSGRCSLQAENEETKVGIELGTKVASEGPICSNGENLKFPTLKVFALHP